MLLDGEINPHVTTLEELLSSAEQHRADTSFGADIDQVNARLHDPAIPVEEK